MFQICFASTQRRAALLYARIMNKCKEEWEKKVEDKPSFEPREWESIIIYFFDNDEVGSLKRREEQSSVKFFQIEFVI